MSEPSTTLDVSGLPTSAFDARSPAWWGNTLFMVIETMTLALLIVSYFYSWQYDNQWPPPQANRGTSSPNPYPGLGRATLDLFLTIASCAPAVWLDRRARVHDARRVAWGQAALVSIGGLLIVLRFGEFSDLGFRWDENAYASLVWTMLAMHLTYLMAAVLENATTLAWILLYGVDEHLALDATLTAAYWYWASGVWVVLYGVVFWAPRLL